MEFIKEWWVNVGTPVLFGGILAGIIISIFYAIKSKLEKRRIIEE